MIVTAIATELALHPATWDDSNRGTFERIKAKLTFKWPKTLIDKLGFNHIDTHPLKARMVASGPPSHTSTARRIPHNYLEQAGQKVVTLLKEGVIVRSPEATPWLNPAFF